MGQFQFKLPDIGEGTAEAEIVAWHVKPGDKVKEDQPLVDMMTDKATVELSSPVDGVVAAIAGKPGDKAAVGSVLVTFDTGAAGVATKEPANGKPAPAPAAAPAAAPAPAPAPAKSAPSPAPVAEKPAAPKPVAAPVASHEPRTPTAKLGAKPMASPAVRQRAEELGVKLQYVTPTGPQGRITHEDLDAYLQAGERAGAPTLARAKRDGVEDIPVIGLRRQIAERMQLSKRHIPHFSYVEEVDMTALDELRAHLNANKAVDQPKLTVLPFLMQAMVKAMPAFPQMNALYDDEAGVVHRHAAVHLGIATQTDKGLMVPVIRHAEALDLWQMASEILRLAAAARNGSAKREELTGSTITITSLGTLGGIVSTPVINRPEVAIINPNKMVERPMVKGGQVVIRKMMNLSSSFDHRVVDGADAAEFIQRLKGLLEQPATIFIN